MRASANAQATTDSPAPSPAMMMNLTRSVPATQHPPPPIPDFPAHPRLLSVRCAAHILEVVSPNETPGKGPSPAGCVPSAMRRPACVARVSHRAGAPSTLRIPCSAPSANSKCVPADPPQVPGQQAGTPPHHAAADFAAATSSMPFASRAPLPCPRWIGASAAKRLVAGGRAPRHPAALAPAAAATPLLVQDVSPQVGSVRVWRGGLFAGGQAPRHPVAHAAPAAAVCAKFSSSGGVGARAAQRLVAGGQLLQRSGVQRRASPYHPLPQLCILLAQLVHLWRQAKKL